ncbi:dihydrofolate reductase [Subtercola boreus]|uniref:dihydrofolate reductase n=1 Tax=Subtercola boreus TaxID=120213 RepID=A0A3E0W7M2_9MICO|nr:dihydrofolate reductase [Subtercola boreus]RFA19013.1 hypothetical protein B7R24_12800 [Subtercola boreus]RFA19151.1 hypothetical protein B7R23_12780 [Subtercola boreus]RFA25613.1 hypothetical protein B7R25_12900 [Subtercola boreus]
MSLSLIWAEARGGVIGYGGAMPWHLPEDLAHFRELTSGAGGSNAGDAGADAGAAVVMGRRTWDSLPERFRPLPGRRNLVLTRDPDWTGEGAEPVSSLDAAAAAAGAGGPPGPGSRGAGPGASGAGASAAGAAELWVIGGGQLYREAMRSALATRLEVTELDLGVKGDTFAPAVDATWDRLAATPWLESRTGIRYRFVTYAR